MKFTLVYFERKFNVLLRKNKTLNIFYYENNINKCLAKGLVQCVVLTRNEHFLQNSKSFLVFSSISLVVACIYLFGSNYLDVSARQQSEWRTNDRNSTPTSNYLDATNWLKNNSEVVDTVATKVTSSSPRISILTERRDFAGNVQTIRLAGLNSEFEGQRRQILANFTSNGDCESAEGLRANDVAFVLVDLTNPDTPDVDRCADEVFRNETVVVYTLK